MTTFRSEQWLIGWCKGIEKKSTETFQMAFIRRPQRVLSATLWKQPFTGVINDKWNFSSWQPFQFCTTTNEMKRDRPVKNTKASVPFFTVTYASLCSFFIDSKLNYFWFSYFNTNIIFIHIFLNNLSNDPFMLKINIQCIIQIIFIPTHSPFAWCFV